MFYYTYVLKSLKDKKLYIGWTEDLVKRIKEHNNKLVQATKYRVPLQLIYYEASISKTSAIKREKQVKTSFGRAYLNRRLSC